MGLTSLEPLHHKFHDDRHEVRRRQQSLCISNGGPGNSTVSGQGLLQHSADARRRAGSHSSSAFIGYYDYSAATDGAVKPLPVTVTAKSGNLSWQLTGRRRDPAKSSAFRGRSTAEMGRWGCERRAARFREVRYASAAFGGKGGLSRLRWSSSAAVNTG